MQVVLDRNKSERIKRESWDEEEGEQLRKRTMPVLNTIRFHIVHSVFASTTDECYQQQNRMRQKKKQKKLEKKNAFDFSFFFFFFFSLASF